MNRSPRILVTGVNGLIGGRIFERLTKDNNVLGSSRNSGSYNSNQFDLSNVGQIKAWLDLVNPDVIINCGGVTAVQYAEDNKEETWLVNVLAVEEITKWSKLKGSKLIQFSTDFVFDGKNEIYSESDMPKPLSFYGKSKLQAEQIALSNSNAVVIRTSLVYGFSQKLSRSNFPLWLIEQLNEDREITITADQFRSPTCVYDLSEAVSKLVWSNFVGIINLAGKDRVGVYDFAMSIAEVFELNNQLMAPIITETSKTENHRPLSSALDIELARNSIGYEPKSLVNSLIEMRRLMNYKSV
jgi:dTDP-4-dehydrorhamnose reductase